uniref:Beta-galactosidase n=1 Tax=Meloidogyne hapla TaxID=6305 RepID=A0A1I8C146_MELHA
MFNYGTSECERWGFEYLEVPVACECYLSKRSVWLEAVPPIDDH